MRINVTAAQPLFDFLQAKLGDTSKSNIKKMLKHGAVLLQGKAVSRPDTMLAPGQVVEIIRVRPPVAGNKSAAPFPVLLEDNHLVAIEKPPGILSIATEREKQVTLYKKLFEYVQLESYGKERIFIVHRLDREVSGVMLFAKTEEIQEALQRNWTSTEKIYVALVENGPKLEQGTVHGWLRENRAHQVYSAPEGPHAQEAVTHYRVLKRFPKHTLLEVRIDTGRKHQIRAHLSELGCPIVGDKKYGAHGSPIQRMGLHAVSLSFNHPIGGKRHTVSTPIPRAFTSFGKRA